MSNPGDTAADTGTQRASVCDEINRSIGSVWQRHAGGRPSSVTTEVNGDVIKCVMQDAVSTIGTHPPDEEAAPDAPARSPNSVTYRNEAMWMVTRLTGRKVLGFIPVRDAKSDVASDTFVLEPRQIKY